TSGATDWYAKPYVREWCEAISSHVAYYAQNVPDDVRLPSRPPLELVVTGGSSAVEPIKEALRGSIITALQSRQIQPELCQGTKLLGVNAVQPGDPVYRPAQVAQMAVALGASSPR